MPLARDPNSSSIPLGSDSGVSTSGPLQILPSLVITAITQDGTQRNNNDRVRQNADRSFPLITFTFSWSEQVRGFAGFRTDFTTDDESPTAAGGAFTTLSPSSGTGLVFTSVFAAKENSSGSVTVWVPRRSTEAVAEPSGRFGPGSAISLKIYYDNTTHVEQAIVPEVAISIPAEAPYRETTLPIEFDWSAPLKRNSFIIEVNPAMHAMAGATTSNSDIQVTDTNTTNPAVINISGLTAVRDEDNEIVPDQYYPALVDNNVSRYTVNITLSGGGTATIRVPQNSVDSTADVEGPSSDTDIRFTYNTAADAVDTDITGSGSETVIYDSGDVPFTNTDDLLASAMNRQELGVAAGGAFKGISDLKRIGGNLYATVQIQQPTGSDLNVNVQSRAVLFRIAARANAGNTIAILKQYKGITEAARSIIARDVNGSDHIWFFEGSQYADYFSIPTETDDWRSRTGHIRSVSQTGTTITPRGLNWRSKFNDPEAVVTYDNTVFGIHRGTLGPLLPLNNNLYLFSGYGSLRFISDSRFTTTQLTENEAIPVTFIDNQQLIRLGQTLLFNIPQLEINGRTGFDVINNLAELVLCYIGFTPSGQFFMTPKYPRESQLGSSGSGSYNTAVTTFADRNRNRSFPGSGTLMIDNELIRYSNRSSTQFTGLTRGAYGTSIPPSHSYGSSVFFVDHVIDLTENYLAKPINELRLRSDSSQLYNQIRLKYANDEREVFKEEPTSVAQNKGRELERSLPLDRHQRVWVEWLADQYLKQYGKLQYIGELQLKPSFHISVGQTIAIREPERTHLSNYKLFQVIRVTQNQAQLTTDIQVRTLNR